MVARLLAYEQLLQEVSVSQDGPTRVRIDRALERVRKHLLIRRDLNVYSVSRSRCLTMTKHNQ